MIVSMRAGIVCLGLILVLRICLFLYFHIIRLLLLESLLRIGGLLFDVFCLFLFLCLGK